MGAAGFDLARSKAKGGADCERLVGHEDDEEEAATAAVASRRLEPSKKVYLLFFISTTVVACFCIFVVIPQIVDYFTNSINVLNIQSSGYASEKQSVIDLLDTERSRRNQERIEIMKKFDSLQQNYKLLQIEYQKAQELYLKKLRSAIENEEKSPAYNSEPGFTKSSSDLNEIFELNDEVATTTEEKSESPMSTEAPLSNVLVP